MLPNVFIPIRTKIFAVATSMLGLLLGAAAYNYSQVRLVNHELIDIAQYLTPLTKYVADANVHVLEQEIHFERVVRGYESEPVDRTAITQEFIAFEERGQWVDQELHGAIALAQAALTNAHTIANQLEFAQFMPLLVVLEDDHQRLHDHGLLIVKLLEIGDEGKAKLLYEQLNADEDAFNQRIEHLLFELGEYTRLAALEAKAHEQATLRTSWILVGSATGLGLLITSIVTMGLIQPVRQLVESSQSVAQGDLDVELSVISKDEIGALTDSFNAMVTEIREKERLKATFGQYVDPRIVDTLVQDQENGQTDGPNTGDYQQGQKRVMTIFFSDIVGFSTISELLTPTGLVTVINEYLTLASVPIKDHGGVLNQFIGDAVSAFWGPPFVGETDHALLACYAAMEQFDQLAKLQRLLPDIMGVRKGLPQIKIRIGLATGDVVAGNIGSKNSKSYTVMGPTVQLAERLEGASKKYGTRILMDETTRESVKETIVTREIDQITVSGYDTPIRIYEPLGYVGTVTDEVLELGDRFQSALNAYQNQQWQQAKDLFTHCLKLQPDDGPSQYYLAKLPVLPS